MDRIIDYVSDRGCGTCLIFALEIRSFKPDLVIAPDLLANQCRGSYDVRVTKGLKEHEGFYSP